MVQPLLLTLAKQTGLYGVYETSTTALAKQAKYSQQSISRLLRDLEAEQLIQRQVTYKGVSLSLTTKGREVLKEEYANLKNLFEEQKSIEGTLFTGLGEGAYYVKKYSSRIKEALGFTPFPGTFNLRVNPTSAQSFTASLRKKRIEGFTTENRSYGPVTLHPIMIGKQKAAILNPERTNHPDNVIEIVAPISLRKALKVKDKQTVEITHE